MKPRFRIDWKNKLSANKLEQVCFLFLLLSIAIYVFLFIRQAFYLYARFALTAFDLGIFDQAVWLISKFQPAFDTVRGMNILADHLSLSLYLLAPLYWIWSNVKILLIVQTLALALASLPLYLFSKKKTGSAPLALLFALAYLLYPALEWINTFDFHPEIFVVPLLLTAFYLLSLKPRFSFNDQRFVFYLVCLFLIAATKETAALTIILLGLYAFKTDRRIGWLTLFFGCLALTAALLILQLFHHGQPSPYFWLYSQFGQTPLAIFKIILTQPLKILNYLNNKQNWFYFFDLFGPLLFLPLFAPEIFVLTLPMLLLNLLSRRIFMHTIYYQYAAFLIPFIFIAAVVGFQRIRDRGDKDCGGAFTFLLSILFLTALIFGLSQSPFYLSGSNWPLVQPLSSYQSKQINKLLKIIPANASVSAQAALVPHLTHRRKIYLFPNPFYQTAYGNSVQVLRQQLGFGYSPISAKELDQTFARSTIEYIALVQIGPTFPLLKNDYQCLVLAALKSKNYGIDAINSSAIILKRGANYQNGLKILSRETGVTVRQSTDLKKLLPPCSN
ncbi:DUF2079 domain-containing protein [Patescibacteria group bacterium]|nr:DUF2079 domain-containing protein [Patescibacteria group bacterium]